MAVKFYLIFGDFLWLMSKIGKKPIKIPEKVQIEINHPSILVKGEEGNLSFNLPPGLRVELKEGELFVLKEKEDKKINALFGLYRQLINNAVLGVQKKWEKKLIIFGTGYNAKIQNGDLVLKLGFSHPVVFKKKEGVEYKVEKDTIISVLGVDKQLVGEVAYQIRQIKPPDAYKGKGIRFEGERLKLKPTKKVKAGATA